MPTSDHDEAPPRRSTTRRGRRTPGWSRGIRRPNPVSLAGRSKGLNGILVYRYCRHSSQDVSERPKASHSACSLGSPLARTAHSET